MSVPIAVTGLIPKTRISSGVIRLPPPMPVRPTRKPTPTPKKTIAGSTDEVGCELRVGGRGRRPPSRRLFHFVPFYDRSGPKGLAQYTGAYRGRRGSADGAIS